ncbi:hypothetical protein KPB05_37235 [Burkholderia gladioli]|uniref:hypothetical protein n=1 Tax=Burkholderia gladioli TaxID=28095 RepID=UPI0028587753|nr:hypothetical protein [Burkholderia gladioli]MDR8093103.1 hypothetical protein [Burkholderia gladioli]
MSLSHHPVVPCADTFRPLSLETIALDLAFSIGMRWRDMPGDRTARVMDYVGGTQGLHRYFSAWADEFLRHWDGLAATEQQEYQVEFELYVTATLDELASRADAMLLSSELAS